MINETITNSTQYIPYVETIEPSSICFWSKWVYTNWMCNISDWVLGFGNSSFKWFSFIIGIVVILIIIKLIFGRLFGRR